jgi:hypothetical protein
MKKALLIGNEDYKYLESLNLCSNDVNDLEKIFIDIGFEVKKYTNLYYEDMKNVIIGLNKWVKNGDEILVFFTGHGFSFEQNNYITCKDSLSFEKVIYADVMENGYNEAAKVVPISKIISALEHNQDGVNILLLDACREILTKEKFEDEILKRKSYSGFLEYQKAKKNFFISYATAVGEFAYENLNEKNSQYVKALLNYIPIKDITLEEIFNCVVNEMSYNCKNQIPWVSNSLTKSYTLVDNTILNSQVELFNIKATIELFAFLVNEINQVEDNQDREKIRTQLEESIEGMIYLPPKIIDSLIDKVIISFEEKCGFIYILLEENDIQLVDVYEDRIFIEDKTGKSHYFTNDNLYNFDDILVFLNNYKKMSSNNLTLEFSYKNKTILMPSPEICKDKYFQIGVKTKFNQMKNYIRDIEKIKEIEANLNVALKNKDNILIIGSALTIKEEFITSISEKFKESEKILKFDSDTIIECRRGIVKKESITLREIVEYSDVDMQQYLLKLKENTIDRMILPYKSYCKISSEKLTALMEVSILQLIVIQDLRKDIIKSSLKNIDDEFMRYLIPTLKYVDLIIVLDSDKKGTYIDSIYNKQYDDINKIF